MADRTVKSNVLLLVRDSEKLVQEQQKILDSGKWPTLMEARNFAYIMEYAIIDHMVEYLNINPVRYPKP